MLRKISRLLKNWISYNFMRNKGTLVYLGMHKGDSFDAEFRRYRQCFGFEADPELCDKLKKRFGKYKNVHIFNAAVTGQDGEVDFHISSNDGASSSVGHFKEEWGSGIKMVKTIRIRSINLLNFLEERGVKSVDAYVSDIQGMDLTVLKTLKPWLDEGKIETITCEVTKDRFSNIYKDLPGNTESEFNDLLKDNYECVAKGWGAIKDGDFSDVPESWWEMDCKWRLKRRPS